MSNNCISFYDIICEYIYAILSIFHSLYLYLSNRLSEKSKIFYINYCGINYNYISKY